MKTIECSECEQTFNPYSREKKKVGGKFNHCPECSEEFAVKHVGVGNGCGKQNSIQILSFESQKDRAQYVNYWNAASGMGTGKNCNMAYLPSPIKQNFRKIGETVGNVNHKGRAD